MFEIDSSYHHYVKIYHLRTLVDFLLICSHLDMFRNHLSSWNWNFFVKSTINKTKGSWNNPVKFINNNKKKLNRKKNWHFNPIANTCFEFAWNYFNLPMETGEYLYICTFILRLNKRANLLEYKRISGPALVSLRPLPGALYQRKGTQILISF